MELSKDLQERIAFAKLYIEQKYSLKKQQDDTKRRNWQFFDEQLERLALPHSLRQELRQEVKHKQANFMRQRRVKLSPTDFEMLAVIGRGAFGQVRLCKDKGSADLVAIKRLKKQQMIVKNQIAHIKAQRNLLANTFNPWIVQLKYSFQDSASLYLVMEFLQGGDLMNLLIKRLILTDSQAKFYTAELVLAVQSVHNMNYIHRDLKPDNILLDNKGHIKLSDFGLCKHADISCDRMFKRPQTVLSKLSEINRKDKRNRRQLAYSHVGTPDYIAPQMLLNQGYSQSVDWWSVGVILYQMLVGQAPFCSDTPAQTYAKIQRWEEYLYFPEDVKISPEARDLIEQLVTDASQRLSVDQIKSHPFFEGVDWQRLRSSRAPIVPDIRNSTDVSNFDHYQQEEVWGEEPDKGRDPEFIGYTFKAKQEFNELEIMKAVLKKHQKKVEPINLNLLDRKQERVSDRASSSRQNNKNGLKFNEVIEKQERPPSMLQKTSFYNMFNAHSNLSALSQKPKAAQINIFNAPRPSKERDSRLTKVDSKALFNPDKLNLHLEQRVQRFTCLVQKTKQDQRVNDKRLTQIQSNSSLFHNILKKENIAPNVNKQSKSGKSPLLKKKQQTKGKIASPNFKALLNSIQEAKAKKK